MSGRSTLAYRLLTIEQHSGANMKIDSGMWRSFAFLPLIAAFILMIGFPLVIHGDGFEKICGAGLIVSAVLSFAGWGLAVYSRERSR